MCSCGDYDYPAVFDRREIKRSRKAHKCDECLGEIPAGSAYVSIFGVWDRDPQRFEICHPCESLREEILRLETESAKHYKQQYGISDISCCAPPFGGIWEVLCEMDHDGRKELRPFLRHWGKVLDWIDRREMEIA